MKKFALNIVFALLPLSIMAQFPYETVMTKSLYEDPRVVISSEGKVTWSSIALGSLDLSGIYLGDGNLLEDEKSHSVVLALPQVGLPDMLSFTYISLTKGEALKVYESTDHATWTDVWSGTVEAAITKYDVSAQLLSTTRFLKLEYTGKRHVLYNSVKVTEKKSLSVSTDEYIFPTKKVDATAGTKSVKIYWTNVAGTISSTNPAFTVSRSTFGEKNKEDQTTDVVISYSHETYGTQEGLIVFEAEGLKDTVKVSGTTERYAQTLVWSQKMDTYKTTDKVLLQAYTSCDQPVTYIVSDPDVAEVDENNLLVVHCAGVVDIVAFHPGDRMYEPTDTIKKTVTFVKVDPVISVSASEIDYGQRLSNVQLTEYFRTVAGTLEFRNIDVDTVLDAGTYDLQVAFMPEDTCIYKEVVRAVQVTVNKAVQTITWVQAITSLRVAETISLNAFASSHLPLTYAFSNCNIVIEGDQMTGVEAGEVLVIAFQQGNKNYLPTTVAMQSFEVKDQPTAERGVAAEPTLDELNEDGQKYYHNGQLYIYYRGHIYNAEGLRLK